MQTLRNGYRGLSLLVDLNGDRIVAALAMALALAAGGYLASQMVIFELQYRI